MKIDNITPSVLHVIAAEQVDIAADLVAEETKTIAELLQESAHEKKPRKRFPSLMTNKVSEVEFLKVVDIIAKKLSYKFKFGYHNIEDMKQQITIFAIEGLKHYDHQRPLENFLWTHVRNRLYNFKRDNYQRPDKPCLTCPLYDALSKKSTSQCIKYSDKQECDLYTSWLDRNSTKKNLMYLHTIDEIKDFSAVFTDKDQDNDGLDSAAKAEIFRILDEKLTGEDRRLYLKVKNGNKISKSEMTQLTSKLQNIIGTKND